MPRKADSTPQNPRGKSRDPFEDFERDQWKRPRIPKPGTSGRTDLPRAGYTRASTLGGTLEDQTNLGIWRATQAMWGMSRSKRLFDAVGAVPSTSGKENKSRLREYYDKALMVAETDAAADYGTAIHALREQYDESGMERLGHISGEAREALDQWARLTRGFEILASEAKTVCDEHKVAGTFDVLLRLLGPMTTLDGTVLPAGTVVVGDLKTAATADWFGMKFAVQLAEYGHGVPFDVQSYGRTSWEALGGRPHPRWALIIHIPTGNPKGAGLHWIDIEAGRELAELAITVRNQRNRKDLVGPAAPPVLPDEMTPTGLMAAILGCQSKEAIDALWREHKPGGSGLWDKPEQYKRGPHTRAAKARLDDLAQLASVGG